jgi:hypothetical protein
MTVLVHRRKLTNEIEGKSEQKYLTIFKISKFFQRSKQKVYRQVCSFAGYSSHPVRNFFWKP